MPTTMSDATLPPPRSSSAAPTGGDGSRSDSSSGEVESETSLIESSDVASKEEGPEGRMENKQKRKRTRYVRPYISAPRLNSYYLYYMYWGFVFKFLLYFLSWLMLCLCSPKDQAILEAEYTQNPKPNKAARAVIVEKVDLNEKEVQVSSLN